MSQCACVCVTHAQVEARVAKDGDHARMAGTEGLGHVNPAAGAVDKVQLSSGGPSHLRQHVQTDHFALDFFLMAMEVDAL